ncbi:MAG: single-stranded DNA-binding protein [Bacilli bacterium]
MNKVFLIGRLSRDPELRHTTNGTAVCQINVAISRPVSQGKEPETDFINVTVWNKPAENVARYLSKGRQVAIEGRIQTRSYDNNEGKKVYVTEVIANNVEFLGSANDQNRAVQSAPNDNPFDVDMPLSETTSVDNDPFASFGEKVEISDSDLPF